MKKPYDRPIFFAVCEGTAAIHIVGDQLSQDAVGLKLLVVANVARAVA